MKFIVLMTSIILGSLLVSSCKSDNLNKEKTEPSKYANLNLPPINSFQFTFESAHPTAKALMKDDFFWSPVEETAPFGSDDGSDAAYGFRQWRSANKNTSPVVYFKELMDRWQYPAFNYNEMDTIKIKTYILANDLGIRFLTGQDNAIISIGFAQLAMEGSVDKDIRSLTITSIKRQLLPMLIRCYPEDYQNTRKEQLTQMLEVMNKAS